MTKIREVEVQNLESLDFVKVIEDKKELLEEYDSYINQESNLTIKNLFYTYGIVFIILSLFILKIAIANQVYEKSISIYKKERELKFLRVQKKDIIEKIQKKRYEVEMTDVNSR